MSKKTAFLLIHLIIVLVLTFVAPSAMAEFVVLMSTAPNADIGAEAGIQVLSETSVAVRVRFDRVVQTGTAATDFSANDITVIAYNALGGVEPAPRLTDPVVYNPNNPDGRNFMITVAAPSAEVTSVFLYMGKHKVEVADPRADLDNDGTRTAAGKSAEAFITIHYVKADGGTPVVYSIRKADNPFLPVTAETVNVVLLLSEMPKAFTKAHVNVSNATYVDPIALEPIPETGNMPSTGRGAKLYPYVLAIMPTYPRGKPDIVVKVKAFEDRVQPIPNRYIPPTTETEYRAGIDKLSIKVGKEDLRRVTTRFKLHLPEKTVIPGNGYLVVVRDKAGSAVHVPPGAIDKAPSARERTPAELKYNVIENGDLPDLEAFFASGGVIDVMSPHALVISEVMWGSDGSLNVPSKSQWIELYNAGAAYTTVQEDATTSAFESVTLVFYGPSEIAFLPTLNANGILFAGVTDRIGTIDATGTYWSLAGKGQRGRTGADEKAAGLTADVPTQPIKSMYRVRDTSGKVADGRLASSWRQSTPPNLNFDWNQAGNRFGSPGAARLITATEIAARRAEAEAARAAAAEAADTSVPTPRVGRIYISEVMFAGDGRFSQWIEISNRSWREQVNLSGWTITVENAPADADVSVGAKAKFTIPEGTRIDPSGQHATPSTILVVTEQGENNLEGAMAEGQIVNLWRDRRNELILAGVTRRKYSLLSDMAFKITLSPPTPIAVSTLRRKQAMDVVGNLGTDGTAAWALPMRKSYARSSIIRRHTSVVGPGPAVPKDGTMLGSWILASKTNSVQFTTPLRADSYYGSLYDFGTPGFRAGGALPVELSHLRPARDKATGQVVITWSTQSELNNAGFFIKRSQQRNGEFKVINATMVPGAGTTSEKQFYAYTDTTAEGNVVYYYQIEDVSFDGDRQTLTRGIRLKGHIGAAGKATTTWGELKAVQDYF